MVNGESNHNITQAFSSLASFPSSSTSLKLKASPVLAGDGEEFSLWPSGGFHG